MGDVGFEVVDDGGVGVELLDERGDGGGGGGDVDAAEAEEGEFAAVVVVLCLLICSFLKVLLAEPYVVVG